MSSSCKGYVCLSPLMSSYVPRMIEKCDEKTDTLFGTEVHKTINIDCPMGFEKKCECCGKKFETKRYPTKYCSQACYRKMQRTAVNKRKMKLMKQYDSSLDVICDDGTLRFRKVCDHCGKEFMAPRPNGRFCCTKCHDAHDRKMKQEYKDVVVSEERHKILKGKFLPLKKFCVHCGKEFTAYKQTTMFCSSACAKKYRIRQNIEDRANKVTSESVDRELSRATSKWLDKDVLRINEAAEYLGVSTKSIQRYVQKGYLKTIVMPRAVLICKESLKAMFQESIRFREAVSKAVKHTELPEFQGTPVYQHSNEYITITEASELYGVPLSVMQHWLRKSDLEFERFRNIRFYNREAVDKLVKKRQKAAHPEITEWYTVDEICLEFAMTRKQVYNFTGTHKSLPKRKDSGITYYSKKHVDSILKPKVDPDDYYTAAEVSEKYGIELRRLYKIAKRIGFSSYTTSGKIWYKKDDVDTFFSTGFVTPL